MTIYTDVNIYIYILIFKFVSFIQYTMRCMPRACMFTCVYVYIYQQCLGMLQHSDSLQLHCKIHVYMNLNNVYIYLYTSRYKYTDIISYINVCKYVICNVHVCICTCICVYMHRECLGVL